ncbi:UNVERIFIED_CONTAM: hypothetical protein NCL1_52915 [Trichonephila clavipes]
MSSWTKCLEMVSGIIRQIWKWEIINPDDLDQDNEIKITSFGYLLNSSQLMTEMKDKSVHPHNL